MRSLLPLAPVALLMGCPPNDPGYKPFEDTGLWVPDTESPDPTTTDTTGVGAGTGTGTGGPTTTDTGTVFTSSGVRIKLEPVVTCPDPTLRTTEGPFLAVPVSAPAEDDADLVGSGVVVADFSGDGFADVYWASGDGGHYRRSDGTGALFAADGVLGDFDLADAVGGTAADPDGDGDLDLLVFRDGAGARLLLNDGAGGFTDGSAAWGFGPITTRVSGASWLDIDDDGDLDLFLAGPGDSPDVADRAPAPSYLMTNEGDRLTAQVLPDDLQDAWVHTAHMQVFQAAPGLLTGTADILGAPASAAWVMPDIVDSGSWLQPLDVTALAVADFDGDLTPDVLSGGVVGLDRQLGRSGGDLGVQWNTSDAAAVGLIADAAQGQNRPWSMVPVDVDLDGDLDVAVGFGPWGSSEASGQRDALYIDQGSTFTDDAAAWGLDDLGNTRGLVAADVTGDGWPDLVANRTDGDDAWYASRCGDAHFLRVQLRQPGTSNRFAIGARVVAVVDGVEHARWIAAGSGYASGGPPEALFGLGDAATIDQLVVTWPDREKDELDVAAGDRLVIVTRD